MLVPILWMAGFVVLIIRANGRYRDYLDALAAASDSEGLAARNRREMAEGNLVAPARVVVGSLGTLLRPAPTAELESQRHRATSAFTLAYGYIPTTIFPVFLLANVAQSMLAGFPLPAMPEVTGPGLAIGICVVATVAILVRIYQRRSRLSLRELAAALLGLVGIAFTLASAARVI